jgi:hypothetical protein
MAADKAWFDWQEQEPHKALVNLGEGLAAAQAHRRMRARAALTLWSGSEKWELSGVRSSATSLDELFHGGLAGESAAPFFNVIRAIVDTLHAYLTRSVVHPMFMTERGDHVLQEKAKGMERAAIATLDQLGFYGDLGSMVCLDGLLFEGGGVKIYPDYANRRIDGQRVSSWDVFVSERDARMGRPRSMIHLNAIDRNVLKAFFADDDEAQQAIHDAPNAPSTYANHEPAVDGAWCDQVLVHEAWHLPSSRVDRKNRKAFGLNDNGELDRNIDPGHDGRHVIAIGNHTLTAEPWVYNYFPIAWFKPLLEPLGFWGTSIPELLAAAQSELIKLAERIGNIIDLHAVPTLLLWRKALINKAMWSNDYAKIIETSVPPQQAAYYLNPNSVPADLFSREGQIIQWAREVSGVSELSIAATKPSGIQHAPGLQMLQDTESVRHTPKYRSWERLHMDATRIIIDSHRLLAERDPDMSIVVANSRQLERLKWDEIDIDDDRFHLKPHPVSALPKTPGARKSYVIDLVQNKMRTPEQGMRLLELPDTEAETGDIAAAKEAIEVQLSAILRGEKGRHTIPLPCMDLELAQTLAQQRQNRALADGVDPDIISALQQYWDDCRDIRLRGIAEEKQAAEGIAPPGRPGPGPGGPGGPAGPGGPPGGEPMPGPPPNSLPPAPGQMEAA